MSDKQKLIRKMIKMQKAFIERQRAADADVNKGEESETEFTNEHEKMAMELVDIAHREQGTSR